MRIRYAAVGCLAVTLASAETGAEYFEKSVRPLLVAKCNACHGAANPAGGLRLDSREAILKGGARGPAVIAGKPGESLLLTAVRQTGALKMPPGSRLPDAELVALTRWIEMGLPWGAAVGETQGGKFWSFVPPGDSQPPAVKNRSWVKSPLDAFVLAGLEAKGLAPARSADKRTLLRRATYDLTGLPPTPEEVRAFLDDSSPDAFAKVVDRLLASPRYGERWGRHWLDVARYADSNGLDENLVYKNAFRYRDYVIAAFNRDKPYDQFVHEQLAGDLLPESGDLKTTFERWTATGFLSLGAKMLAEDDPVKMRVDIIDEQLDTAARTFMGLTIGCARCHDHKFDPIPQADYYAMAGIFKSSHTMDHYNVVAKWHEYVLAPKEDREKLNAHLARVEELRKQASKISGAENAKLTSEAKAKIGKYLLAAYDVRESSKVVLRPLTDATKEFASAKAAAANVPLPLKKKEANVTKGGKGPWFAEYKVSVAQAGDYQIDIFDEERGAGTADLKVNGVLAMRGAPPVENREASPDEGGWALLGVFTLQAGENTLRFEHRARFPYFGAFRVAASPVAPGTSFPRNPVQIAARHGVNASFLVQLVEHLERSKAAPASVLYAFEVFGTSKPLADWTSPVAALLNGVPPGDLNALAARYQELFSAANAESKDPGHKALHDLLTEKFGPFRAPGDGRSYYPEAAREELARIDARQKELEAATPEYPQAMGVREEDKIEDMPVHIRGSHWTLGKTVSRGFLSALAIEEQPSIAAGTSGRLELARWLTAKQHPLTARVMANRIWRWHFGRGIVPSTDNFGRLGEKPTNQPLLDWLAHRFMESGWSVKAMHRMLMLSNTYQMSSEFNERHFEADPENTLLWRANRRRLEAESIRDGIMAVSGGLQQYDGGSILTYKDRQYVANTSKRGGVDYERSIRAVYIPVVRSSMYEVFTAFDLPDPSVPNGDRDATVVAPQALFMMNGRVVLEHSRKFAEMLMARAGDDASRIAYAYERALARPPSARETDQALTFLAQLEKALPADKAGAERRTLAWQSLAKALIASSEFIYIN